MARLKLGPIPDDKPVKITVELPASLRRDLVAYTEILARKIGRPAAYPMTDRADARKIHRDRSGFRQGAALGSNCEAAPSSRCMTTSGLYSPRST